MPCGRMPDDEQENWTFANGPHPRHQDAYDSSDLNSGYDSAVRHFAPLLCSACRALERFGYDFDENPALSVWWAKHKAEDARKAEAAKVEADKRAYRKAKAQEAMAKPLNQLTDEERKLLREEGFLK